MLRACGPFLYHLLAGLFVFNFDFAGQAGLNRPFRNPVAEGVLGFEWKSGCGQDEGCLVPATQFQLFGKFPHQGNEDVLRTFLLRLPAKVCSAVLELDVFGADVDNIVDPPGHVFRKIEPPPGHRPATMF
ncbi:hypothetical protein [Primorskyibacter marinus]|uniref:hypothetical protein n=1 Tax=Primorskyibacter marinus TaxID=1977320 RepID=UPI0018E5466E|nr:hypothetical protein [Primorskyibacter marinus]